MKYTINKTNYHDFADSSINYIWIETIAYGIAAALVLVFTVEKNLAKEQQEIAARKQS